MNKNKHFSKPHGCTKVAIFVAFFLLFFGLHVKTAFAASRFEWVDSGTINDTQTNQVYKKDDSGDFIEQNATDSCPDKIHMESKEKGTFFENKKITVGPGPQVCGDSNPENITDMRHPEKSEDSSKSSGTNKKDCVEISVKIDGSDCIDSKNQNPIYGYIRGVIKFLSAGVGVVVMLMIVISGIQYITSSGNPEAVQAAKKRLTNAVLALVLFIFMFAILNFLVPGGLLG